jgi:hypothetical protein
MTIYRRVEIVNGESAEPVAWVAVHPVNWPGWVGAPDAGFVEDEATERRLAAAEWLAVEADRMLRLLNNLSAVIYKPEVQEYLPHGLADEVRAWVRRNKTDAALAEWQAALPRSGGEQHGD